MKLISLSTHDLAGGAAVAATRLHKSLRQQGINSTMIVGEKIGTNIDTVGIDTNFSFSLRRNLDRLPLSLDRTPKSIGWKNLSWLPNPKLAQEIKNRAPDLVHIHWTQNGFMPLSLLTKIKVPIVWTFHDLWPVCGSFHHEYENDLRYPEPYTKKNRPRSRKGLDLDRMVANRKAAIYKNTQIQAIVPSRWMAEQVQKSHLWQGRPLEIIPIGLDSSIFKPVAKPAMRDLMNLPSDKKIILFGAMNPGVDKNKGYPQLREALAQLGLPQDQTECVVFGLAAPPNGDEPMPYKTHWQGLVKDAATLTALYAAADVMVVPSLQESFGQTASEALACGTPVVAFNTSGLRDIVDHEKNGYLAKPFDPADLAAGIRWVLASSDRQETLSRHAREKVLTTFDSPIVAQKHIEIYQRLLDANA